MVSLKDIGERTLISNIKKIIRPAPQIGPGDDAALVDITDKVVITTDTVTIERHKPRNMTWEQFGWTAAAVNLSDIASMGARPVGLLAALVLPEDMDEDELYDIMSGMDQCAEFCDTYIVGGDTKFGHGSVTGTAIGTLDGRVPLTRSGATPGDMVAVTGNLGSAAAGFYAMENGIDDEETTFALLVPIPRVEEGIIMSKSGAVTSCMDLSDGIAEAARAICSASHVGMEIQMEFLPVLPNVDDIASQLQMDRKDLILYWGGDYELLFTFKKEKIINLYQAGLAFSIIGMVTNEDGPYILEDGKRTMMKNGQY
jgi:thiamine-monophosphate kinase